MVDANLEGESELDKAENMEEEEAAGEYLWTIGNLEEGGKSPCKMNAKWCTGHLRLL